MSDVISIQRQVSSSAPFMREREQKAQAIAQKIQKELTLPGSGKGTTPVRVGDGGAERIFEARSAHISSYGLCRVRKARILSGVNKR